MTIRAIIADDEPLARQRVRDLLSEEHDVEIIGECEDGLATVDAVVEHHPDLLFLDIQMPGIDGFDVLDALDRRPAVVFTTAYDAFALRAFDENAVDYLLKPLDAERFRESLARARHALMSRTDEFSQKIDRLLRRLDRQGRVSRRFVVRQPRRIRFFEPREVDWFDAEGNYVRLHVGGDSHLIRMTMHALEERLDSRTFVRIHRSTIVNTGRIVELRPALRGDYEVVLKNGTTLRLQRAFRDRLRDVLGDF